MLSVSVVISRLSAPLFVSVITRYSRMSGKFVRNSYLNAQRKARYEDCVEEYFAPAAPSLEEYERRRKVVAQSRRDVARCSTISTDALF